MAELLQTNLSFVIASVLIAVLLGVRAAVRTPSSRQDLRGAIVLFVAFIGLWTITWAMPATIDLRVIKLLRVGWKLAFAFAVIRTVVSISILLLRLRSKREVPQILRNVVDFTLYATAALPIVRTELHIDLTGLLATSAILSVVLGLALQDTLGNLFAGLSLQFERPYELGDWVQIKDQTGKVVQVAWRSIRIETTKREVITLPNSIVSKEAVKNLSRKGHAGATEIPLVLSYDAPPNKVKAVIIETLSQINGCLQDPPPSVLLMHYDDSGARYRVRFYAAEYAPSDRVLDELHSRLWYRFRREGIEIPYPTRTVMTRPAAEAGELTGVAAAKILESVDILSVLTVSEREHLAKELRPRRFGKGEQIIEAGEKGQTFYVVAEGRVSVRTGTPSVEVTRLERGQYFGEMSLLTGDPRTATVIALEDVVLLELDRPAFARLFAGHPDLAKELSALLASRRQQLRAALATAEQLQDATPEAGRILSRLRQIFGLAGE